MLDLERSDLRLEDAPSTLIPVSEKFGVNPSLVSIILKALYKSLRKKDGNFLEVFEGRYVNGAKGSLVEAGLVIEDNNCLRLTEKTIIIFKEASKLQKELASSKCIVRFGTFLV